MNGSSHQPSMHSDLEVALFVDATETLFRIGDQLHRQGFAIPAPPQRHGVANADEIRERMLHGINPIAAMSLDDAIGIRYGEDPAGHDLAVIAGVHRGFLELMVAPDYRNWLCPGLDRVVAASVA
jgi:hypothetical protein